MTNKKRFLTFILTFCMLICSITATMASAEETDAAIDISTTNLLDENIEANLEQVNIETEDELMPLSSTTCTSVNQMQRMVIRNQAPSGVVAVHSAHSVTGQPHIHFTTGAINIDGSVHDGVWPKITNAIRTWMHKNGWCLNV